jgi:hypothetical protein
VSKELYIYIGPDDVNLKNNNKYYCESSFGRWLVFDVKNLIKCYYGNNGKIYFYNNFLKLAYIREEKIKSLLDVI